MDVIADSRIAQIQSQLSLSSSRAAFACRIELPRRVRSRIRIISIHQKQTRRIAPSAVAKMWIISFWIFPVISASVWAGKISPNPRVNFPPPPGSNQMPV